MFDHDDDCDKVNYEGGICTCEPIRQYGRDAEDASEAASLRAMEDYDGPELDG